MAPKPLTWWQRLRHWVVDNLTPCYMVRRLARDTTVAAEHAEHWLSMGYAPHITWEKGTHRALLTWKWNAQRLARHETARTGELYLYEAVRMQAIRK